MKERLRIQGLRKRWILNSVGPVILILVLAAILASATVANNYYGSARSTLEAKAKAGADYFNSYSMSSYSEYYRNASLYAASFDSTRIELQFLNLYGRVDNSTQGVAAGTAPQTPELARALESGSIEVFSGKDPVTGESVMAVRGVRSSWDTEEMNSVWIFSLWLIFRDISLMLSTSSPISSV